MPTGTLAPSAVFIGFDAAGVTLPGGKLSTFAAGTSTPLATYTDVNLTTPNANPVILDSGGRAVLYLSAASYKFVLKNSADLTQWTQDNIAAVPASQINVDITGTAGESLAAGDVVYLSSGAADGGRTAGQWYKADADFPLRSTTANALGMCPAAIAFSASGSIRLSGSIAGLSGLTAGVLYYVSATAGALTSVAPANARAVATADSTTSVVLSQFIPVPVASATVAGIVSLGAQVLGTGTKTVAGLTCTGASDFDFAPTFNAGVSTTDPCVVSGRMFRDAVSHTTASAGVEADLTSVTVPANTLSADGAQIRVWASGKYATTGANKRLRLYFGGTVIFEFTANAGVVLNAPWQLVATITRTGASAEVSAAIHHIGGQATNTAAGVPLTNIEQVGFDNLAIATNAGIIVKTTGLDTTSPLGTVQTSFVLDVVG